MANIEQQLNTKTVSIKGGMKRLKSQVKEITKGNEIDIER